MLRRASLLLLSVAFAVAACSGTGASPAASRPAASAASAPAGSGASIAVTARDYAFENVPDTIAPGTTLTLVNQGQELHELVLFRRNAGVPQSFEELLAMADASALVTVLGGIQAAPGTTAPGSVTADQAGDYALVCFIPQGTTAPLTAGSPGAGPPHFTLGFS